MHSVQINMTPLANADERRVIKHFKGGFSATSNPSIDVVTGINEAQIRNVITRPAQEWIINLKTKSIRLG